MNTQARTVDVRDAAAEVLLILESVTIQVTFAFGAIAQGGRLARVDDLPSSFRPIGNFIRVRSMKFIQRPTHY